MTESLELSPLKPVAQADFIVTTSPEKIKGLQERYKSLTLKGTEYRDGKVVIVDSLAMLADKQGLQLVTEARKDAMKHRTRCAAEHQKLKEDAKAECDRLDKWKRDCTALIVEVEDKFKSMEKAVEDEIIAIETRELDQRQSVRDAMVANAGGIPAAMKLTMNSNFVRVAMPEQFDEWLHMVTVMNEQLAERERLRLEKEESERIEAKRLADQKEKADRLQAIADENQRIENKRIADENAKRQAELDEKEKSIEAKQEELANMEIHHSAAMAPFISLQKSRITTSRFPAFVTQSRIDDAIVTAPMEMNDIFPKPFQQNSLQSDIELVKCVIQVIEAIPTPKLASFYKSYAEGEIKIVLGNAIGRLNGLLEKMNSNTTEGM